MTLQYAKALYRRVHKCIGIGFHPDTRFEDYITRDGTQCFKPETAEKMNHRFETVYETLEANGICRYGFGLENVREMFGSN